MATQSTASSAYTTFLEPLLSDAEELDAAHRRLRTGGAGRQWGIGALNRGAVIMCLSAWEAYVEELAKEVLEAFRPLNPAGTSWQSLNASVRSQIGRFNTPSAENVRMLLSDAIGLPDVTQFWQWRNTTPQQARERLQEAIRLRHEIAHGVNPRPTIHNSYSSRLPGLFRRLGRTTDVGVRAYLVVTLGVANPWP